MPPTPKHLSTAELQVGLELIRQSPADSGVLELIVRRPAVNAREVLNEAQLDVVGGLEGDRWATSSKPVDKQLTIMNSRVIALLAQDKQRWALAGDQLYVDLDLSEANLPTATRLTVGGAVLEITAPPHTGCGKFTERFGSDAMNFVNSPLGKALRLRGVNAKVVQPGLVRLGDVVKKLIPPQSGQ